MKTNRMCGIVGSLHRYTELLPLTEKRPLATLPFDCKYRLIDFNLSSIKNANIHELFMLFNEGETQSVFDHLGGGKEWNLDGVQNRYFIHLYQDFLKEQAAGKDYFRKVIDYLEKSKSDHTVYMGSKILCNIDLRGLLKIHQLQGNDMTVVYKRIDKEKIYEKDILFTLSEEGKLLSATEAKKTQMADVVNLCTDIFIIKTEVLIESLKEGQKTGMTANIGKFLREKIDVKTTGLYEYTGYLSNVYDINSYYQANMDMLDPHKFNSLLYANQKIYTKLKNEVPTYYAETSEVKNSHLASGCIVEGKANRSLIGRGSKIKQGALIEESLLFANNKIGENAEIKYAILDKNVVVESGVKIIGTKDQPVVIKKDTLVTADVYGGDQR